MNAKGGSGIVVGLIVALGDTAAHYFLDRTKDKDALLTNTATALVAVETKVEGLTKQIERLSETPYVGRTEFEGRLAGLEQRVSNVERAEQPYLVRKNGR